MELFKQHYTFGEPLRSVGIRAINLKGENTANQMDIFGDAESDIKLEKVEKSIYALREKFGNESIKRGRNI